MACRYLEDRGWTVRERNVRLGPKEIDVIAERSGLIAFVEVKTRSLGRGDPLEAVTIRKRRHLRQAAGEWIRRRGRPGLKYRFDVIAVTSRPGRRPAIEHVDGIWWNA